MAANEKTIEVPRARQQFNLLLAGNPNYFGTAIDSVFDPVEPLSSETRWEELTSLGYNPRTKKLYATYDMKQSGGYNGDLCDDGSTEYVRFYVDHGSGWVDVGLTGRSAHDIPAGRDCAGDDTFPLSQSVELHYAPKGGWCKFPRLPRVRAILSWNHVPPAGWPDWTPAFGNVLECNIQIEPSWTLHSYLDDVKAKFDLPKEFLDGLEPIIPPDPPIGPDDGPVPPWPLPDPPAPEPPGGLQPVPLHARLETYSIALDDRDERTVAPARVAYPEIQRLATPANLMTPLQKKVAEALAAYEIDLSDLVEQVEKTSGNVSYEELVDVGLDRHLEKVVATFHVKRPNGYLGGPCSKGSTEYVAFWADWDDSCEWSYLGTGKVRVHDYHDLPDGGLCYSVALPVDVDEFKKFCDDPAIARLRAVLSWETPPSRTNPDAVPRWGNRLDAHALMPVRYAPAGQLYAVGNVLTSGIDPTDGTAQVGAGGAWYIGTGVPQVLTSSSGLSRPFGGVIYVRGMPVLGSKYRLRVIDSSGSSTTLTEKVRVVDSAQVVSDHHGDPNGWFDYLDHADNTDHLLGIYRSSGNELVTIVLEIDGFVADTQRVQLDNTRPAVHLAITDPGQDCDVFGQGTVIGGSVSATDTNFDEWIIDVIGGPASFGSDVVDSDTAEAIPPLMPAPPQWTYKTGTVPLPPCGYTFRLRAWDRTIVHSNASIRWSRSTTVGFSID